MNRRMSLIARYPIAVGLLTLSSGLIAAEPTKGDAAGRRYWTDISFFSFYPGKAAATYQSHGGGGAGPGSTFGTGTSRDKRYFNLSIRSTLKAGRFLASVEVIPGPEDKQTQAQKIEYDLSDLRPQALEIARDDDGRTYQLNLAPSVIVEPTTQFKASDLRLDHWHFPASPVILNDQDYLGQLGMRGGQLCHCDIPGLARIEFSLLHLKDSSPIGTLDDGVINIAHNDGTTLRISNVKNGANITLPGGPYLVWVRWKKSTQTLEEYRQDLRETIASLKKQAGEGDLAPRPGLLERLEKMLKSDRVVLNEFGLEEVSPDDLADPQ